MEGEGEGSRLGDQWKEKEKVLCYLFPLFSEATLLKLSFLSFDIEVLLTMVLGHYLPIPLLSLAYTL
jgi:hypothetical protein